MMASDTLTTMKRRHSGVLKYPLGQESEMCELQML